MVIVVVAIVGALLLAADPGRAATTVLVMTGDAAVGGERLDSISAPSASRDTATFLGGTSAVLATSGGVSTVVARTRDPLPAPLDGTLNQLSSRVVINDDGVVAFGATLNSRLASEGPFLFLHERDGLVPVTDGTALLSGGVGDLNRQGDLLYTTGRTLWLWRRSARKAVALVGRGGLAPGGGSFEFLSSRPVLNDSGLVAFVAIVNRLPGLPTRSEAVGVFTVDGSGRVSEVLPAQPASRRAARQFLRRAVAINAAGAVAFTAALGSVEGAFLFSPAGSLTPVARAGDLIGPERLAGFDPEYVGVDSSGRVAFEGVFDDGPRLVIATGGSLAAVSGPLQGGFDFAPRLTDSGRIAWVQDGQVETFDGESAHPVVAPDATPVGPSVSVSSPSINDGGVVAFAARQDGLYVRSPSTLARVAAIGDAVGGAPIATIGTQVVRGDTIAFFANSPALGPLLAVGRGGGPLVKVVAQGDPSPIGGTFDFQDEILDAGAGHVFFVSSVTGGSAENALFEANVARHTVRALVKRGDAVRGHGRIASFGQVSATRKGPAFVAGFDDGTSGVFLWRRSGPVPVVTAGHPVQGTEGRSLVGVDAFVMHGDSLLLEGSLSGVDSPAGLFLWRAGRISKVFLDGELVPGSGPVISLEPIALGRRRTLFLGSFSPLSDTGLGGLGIFERHGRSTQRFIGAGDTVLGATITDIERPAAADGSLIVAVELDPPAPARAALLRVGR